MPTDLPIGFSSLRVRAVASRETDGIRAIDGIGEFFQTLLLFYLGVAGIVLMLMAVEYELGAFRGLTLEQMALNASGAAFAGPLDGGWLPAGP